MGTLPLPSAIPLAALRPFVIPGGALLGAAGGSTSPPDLTHYALVTETAYVTAHTTAAGVTLEEEVAAIAGGVP